ncbi:MAG: peptidase M28, partial [Dehalococcoidales bacterium]|nr:peptidase M28 [Dehalococcoidales bacterium]
MDETEKLLKELTEATGVPGYETEIRGIIRKYFQPFGEIVTDNIGSLICRKTGTADHPKIALAGHMDEIGFMVKYITKEGFIRF